MPSKLRTRRKAKRSSLQIQGMGVDRPRRQQEYDRAGTLPALLLSP